MRFVRLFFAALAGIWLCVALLRLFSAFSHPDAFSGGVSFAIGYATIPLILFWFLAFGGRPSRRRQATPKVPDSKDAVPPSLPK
jgi:hypothetical protein